MEILIIILIINGSPRKNGAAFKILNCFKELFENSNNNIDIKFVNLIDYNIKYCIGCKNCYKTGKWIFLDDRIEEIHNIITYFNGIIFGSPTYAGNVSGLFKSFNDRVHMKMQWVQRF